MSWIQQTKNNCENLCQEKVQEFQIQYVEGVDWLHQYYHNVSQSLKK